MISWQIMSPTGGGQPTGTIVQAINHTFRSLSMRRLLMHSPIAIGALKNSKPMLSRRSLRLNHSFRSSQITFTMESRCFLLDDSNGQLFSGLGIRSASGFLLSTRCHPAASPFNHDRINIASRKL
jgi:hypothetical protein